MVPADLELIERLTIALGVVGMFVAIAVFFVGQHSPATLAGLLRRLRFGLRTLFVVVTVAAMLLGWLRVQYNWVRQRHEFLEGKSFTTSRSNDDWEPVDTPAPGLLWLLGERGVDSVEVRVGTDEVAEVTRLFPEAQIRIRVPPEDYLR